MTIELIEESTAALSEYGRIPIAFTVDRVFDVTAPRDESGSFTLVERRLDTPYEKNYDIVDGDAPLHWTQRFDLSNWTLFTARLASQRVGGAAVAFDTPGVDMLEGRRDLAVLWDLRVAPNVRGQGVGAALFDRVESWARSRGCRQLKVETQNTNVSACRFYERQGCELRSANRGVYPELPEEIQLLWFKDLVRR
jgi:GNAT superfamily N-acetyltransferase